MVNERIDEATGSVKEITGKVTGNEVQEAQGKAQADAARANVDRAGDHRSGQGRHQAGRRRPDRQPGPQGSGRL